MEQLWQKTWITEGKCCVFWTNFLIWGDLVNGFQFLGLVVLADCKCGSVNWRLVLTFHIQILYLVAEYRYCQIRKLKQYICSLSWYVWFFVLPSLEKCQKSEWAGATGENTQSLFLKMNTALGASKSFCSYKKILRVVEGGWVFLCFVFLSVFYALFFTLK